jgi:hypothetical protein
MQRASCASISLKRAQVFKHLLAAPAQRIINGRTGVSGTRCLRLRFAREHHLAFLGSAKGSACDG